MPSAIRNRFSIYILVNLGFVLLVGIGSATGGFPEPRLPHLILLFALCSSVLIDLDGFNGRYAILALFMFVYFVSYGVQDLTNLFTWTGSSTMGRMNASFLSAAEVVILVGGLMWVLGYRIAVTMVIGTRSAKAPREWPERTILIVGLIFWVVGTIATYRWQVYVIPDTTNDSVRKGLASLSPIVILAYLIGQMCQPLGILLVAYAFRVSGRAYLLILSIIIIVLQLFIGFVVDIKGLAMLGIILMILTSVLVDGRLPKVWLAAGVLFVTLLYPYFTAYRTAIHGGGIARTTVVANFGEILEKTSAAKDKVNTGRERAQTFLERSNVKGSVEVTVAKAGNGVAFQNGHTLAPILAAFIPKVLWASKASIPTGQLFNKQFRIDDSDEIYISPSYLGELYWNFGWYGAVIGMGLFGAISGWVGAAFNLAEFRTVTRVLVVVVTIKQLIVGFEGTIADNWVVWLRSLAAIGVLHLLFARVPVASRFFISRSSEREGQPADQAAGQRLFPNLLT